QASGSRQTAIDLIRQLDDLPMRDCMERFRLCYGLHQPPNKGSATNITGYNPIVHGLKHGIRDSACLKQASTVLVDKIGVILNDYGTSHRSSACFRLTQKDTT